jgi:molybdopterin molybdotransferase
LATALALLRDRILPIPEKETVPLVDAAERVLASPLTSIRPVPLFDNAAVDGFAFAAASQDGSGPVRLKLASGRVAAGHPAPGPLQPGQAIRILTGAKMPAGADTVAMNEETKTSAGWVHLKHHLPVGSNRRQAGEDVEAGASLFDEGLLLGAAQIGVIAELGLDRIPVFRRLRVALFSSGDELCQPGSHLHDNGVYDANRFMLMALLRRLPVAVTDLGILPDDAQIVERSLKKAAQTHDVLLTSGGASRGDEDHVVRTVGRHGRLDFWQIAMKPGRPLAFGRLEDAVTIGLPGNPVAAAVCFMRLARPVIARLAGSAWLQPRHFCLPAAFRFRKKPGRTELLRARLLEALDNEQPQVALVRRMGSGVLTSLTAADGLIEVDPEITELLPGDLVRFLSLAELGAA